MRAIHQTTYGTTDRLSFVEAPTPTPAAGQILVEVVASTLTQGDRRLRTGDFPGIMFVPGRLSMGITGPRKTTPGTNFAGRVVAVGDAVSDFSVGDDVFGSALHGAHATHLVVDADSTVAALPPGVGYDEAAALPYGGVTSLVFLRDIAKVQPGERVCILGASGGVGRVAVQLAKHLGAHVTAVASGRHEELVRSLGADAFHDYRSGSYAEAGASWDVVFDTIGASSFGEARTSMTATGRYVSLIITVPLLWHALRTAKSDGQRAMPGVALGDQQLVRDVAALIASGAVRATVAASVPFDRISEAHDLLDAGNPGGDIVIEVRRPEHAAARLVA